MIPKKDNQIVWHVDHCLSNIYQRDVSMLRQTRHVVLCFQCLLYHAVILLRLIGLACLYQWYAHGANQKKILEYKPLILKRLDSKVHGTSQGPTGPRTMLVPRTLLSGVPRLHMCRAHGHPGWSICRPSICKYHSKYKHEPQGRREATTRIEIIYRLYFSLCLLCNMPEIILSLCICAFSYVALHTTFLKSMLCETILIDIWFSWWHQLNTLCVKPHKLNKTSSI